MVGIVGLCVNYFSRILSRANLRGLFGGVRGLIIFSDPKDWSAFEDASDCNGAGVSIGRRCREAVLDTGLGTSFQMQIGGLRIHRSRRATSPKQLINSLRAALTARPRGHSTVDFVLDIRPARSRMCRSALPVASSPCHFRSCVGTIRRQTRRPDQAVKSTLRGPLGWHGWVLHCEDLVTIGRSNHLPDCRLER